MPTLRLLQCGAEGILLLETGMLEAEKPNEGELILYQTQAGAVRIEMLYQSDAFWLNQKKIAELFGVELPTISYHRKRFTTRAN